MESYFYQIRSDKIGTRRPVYLRNSLLSLIPYKRQSLHAHVMHALRRILRPTDVPDTGLLCDVLWADPDPNLRGWAESDRGVSFTVSASEVVLISALSFARFLTVLWVFSLPYISFGSSLLDDFWACLSLDFLCFCEVLLCLLVLGCMLHQYAHNRGDSSCFF